MASMSYTTYAARRKLSPSVKLVPSPAVVVWAAGAMAKVHPVDPSCEPTPPLCTSWATGTLMDLEANWKLTASEDLASEQEQKACW